MKDLFVILLKEIGQINLLGMFLQQLGIETGDLFAFSDRIETLLCIVGFVTEVLKDVLETLWNDVHDR